MKTLIYGAGAQGRVVLDILRARRGGLRAEFVDEDPRLWGKRVNGVLVGGGWERARRQKKAGLVVALGDPRARLKAARAALRAAFPLLSVVHPSAVVAASATLGAGCVVSALAAINSNAAVGAACLVNTGAVVEHDAALGEGATVCPGVLLSARCRVGRGAFLSTGCVVLPRLTVGAGAVVGAAALVTRDVPAGTLVLGAPARVKGRVGPGFDWGRLL